MIHYQIHPENPHTRYINKAIEALNDGSIIIYPTDTVYGLGCSIYQKNAIERLYRLKGKSKFESMSIICNSIQQASQYVRISNFEFRILKRCFPGPYTIILAATREIPKLMLVRKKEIGVRIPENLTCQMLVDGLGHPILNTSLNPDDYQEPELEIAEKYDHVAEIMLDAGPIPDSGESTVLKIFANEIEVLREGKGDLEILYS